MLCLFFVVASSCLLETLSEHFFSNITTNSFGSPFLTAMSFRFDHYFVCYFAQFNAIIGGFSTHFSTYGVRNENFKVTKWTKIELPYSIAEVVVYWNLPMHYFLHKCNKFLNSYIFFCRCISKAYSRFWQFFSHIMYIRGQFFIACQFLKKKPFFALFLFCIC